MSISSTMRAARTALVNHRTERAARRQLAEELAQFQTPAERAELEAMISRHSTQQTREIRAILNRQDYERARRATVLGGLGS